MKNKRSRACHGRTSTITDPHRITVERQRRDHIKEVRTARGWSDAENDEAHDYENLYYYLQALEQPASNRGHVRWWRRRASGLLPPSMALSSIPPCRSTVSSPSLPTSRVRFRLFYDLETVNLAAVSLSTFPLQSRFKKLISHVLVTFAWDRSQKRSIFRLLLFESGYYYYVKQGNWKGKSSSSPKTSCKLSPPALLQIVWRLNRS
jgi:hypothetical protein